MALHTKLGEFLMEKRAERRVTRRGFAQSVGLDPAYYARIERGTIEPPREGVLNRIAEGLGIAKWSADWDEMVRLADLGRGMIPSEIMKDAEVAELLPAFFAKLKEERPTTPDQMYDIYQGVIRERNSGKDDLE
jgi:transcriptional regulator with XRE-family HTH domain